MSINDEEKMAKKLQKAATLESTGVWLTLLPIARWTMETKRSRNKCFKIASYDQNNEIYIYDVI